MKKLLITGFEPFGGEDTNPSWDAVSCLPDRMAGYELTKLRIPVIFGEAAAHVIKAAGALDPDVILCIGQAGGRNAVTPELLGINLRYASIPDNGGNQPKDEPILPDGEDACFTPLPVRRMAEAIETIGVPARVSYSAGAYVCNDVLYTLLAHYKGSRTRVGFIHVPYSTAQNKMPAMELSKMTAALAAAIGAMDGEQSSC